MKTLILATTLILTSILTSCQMPPCKEGMYCAKCQIVYVQTGQLTKGASSTTRSSCPTCGSALTNCTLCR